MNVRDGIVDVAIAAGPRVTNWPSAGVRALSLLCADMGLTVGLYGGESLTVRGVLPLSGTGGLVIGEDAQKRLHRIRARAVVKVSAEPSLPDPFPGSHLEGLLPLSTALRLRREGRVHWDPAIVVLGSGNRALRFGSALLESGTREVFCVEMEPTRWGAKRFAGWEVERRRFEMDGGKLLEGKPVELSYKSPLLWQFRLQDARGIRVLEVARVVSAGPFQDLPGVREYPPGSFLFELEQTAAATYGEDVEGWVMERERGRYLAGKIVRALVAELGDKRDEIDKIFTRARGRLKRYYRHREEPFTPAYQGKWIAPADSRAIRAFRGVPQKDYKERPVASIECFEEIPCSACMKACPENAIEIGHVPRTRDALLIEGRCTACGLCLDACPSNATFLLKENEDRSFSQLTLAWRGSRLWSAGEFATLLNRRAESLGSARVSKVEPSGGSQLVTLEVPTHLLWEARAIKPAKLPAAQEDPLLDAVQRSEERSEKVEITLNGEKRLVRAGVPISLALFEGGQARPEEALYCPDGSCGLCVAMVDGVKKLGCRTQLHRGMAIRLPQTEVPTEVLCPCLNVTRDQVIDRMKQGKLQSPDAVLSALHVGEGRCHGQICLEAFRRVLIEQGLDASQWIDWRFPWSDWTVSHT